MYNQQYLDGLALREGVPLLASAVLLSVSIIQRYTIHVSYFDNKKNILKNMILFFWSRSDAMLGWPRKNAHIYGWLQISDVEVTMLCAITLKLSVLSCKTYGHHAVYHKTRLFGNNTLARILAFWSRRSDAMLGCARKNIGRATNLRSGSNYALCNYA